MTLPLHYMRGPGPKWFERHGRTQPVAGAVGFLIFARDATSRSSVILSARSPSAGGTRQARQAENPIFCQHQSRREPVTNSVNRAAHGLTAAAAVLAISPAACSLDRRRHRLATLLVIKRVIASGATKLREDDRR